MYAQKVNGDGNISIEWPIDGVALCTASGDQGFPQIASDGTGGAIITWQDNRGATIDIYAQRVDGDGDIPSGWPADGVALCTASGDQENPQITSDSTGGAIITWEDGRGASIDIYAQRVSNPAPTVTGITPSSGTNDGVVSITNLAGTNFRSGATVSLKKEGESDIPGTGVNVVSSTKITCSFDLTGAAVGPWGIYIANDDGQTDTLAGGFTVEYLPPTVASISPSSGNNLGTVHISALSGTNFRSGAQVRMERLGESGVNAASGIDVSPDGLSPASDIYVVESQIAATNVTVVSSTKITCDFDLTGAARGSWDVVVENDDGKSGRLTSGFLVCNTPSGDNIVVEVDGEARIAFDQVTTPGETALTSLDPEEIDGYVVLEDGSFEIVTTAESSGMIDVTLFYDGDNYTDDEENQIVALHLEDGVWVDRTLSRDPENESVTARVSYLGSFALAFPIQPGNNWYFAEGYTGHDHYPGESFDTWFSLQNVSSDSTEVRATFMTDKGDVIEKDQTVSPHSRYTLHVNEIPGLEDTQFSTKFSSLDNVPFVAERAMYFKYYGLDGGHDSVGVIEPADTWYLAEGYTKRGDEYFDTYILVGNPNDEAAEVVAEFMTEEGVVAQEYTAHPHSRLTIFAGDIVALEGKSFSTKISSKDGVKLVAERSMYFDYHGRKGGHASIGATGPATSWFLAEGFTSESFDTYVLIQNPQEVSAEVTLSFMTPGGLANQTSLVVPPKRRRTVLVNAIDGLSSTEVSTEVTATSGSGIVVERAMYFDYNGKKGGHCSVGVAATDNWIMGKREELSFSWCMAEGYTGSNFDTYLLIQNPNGEEAEARVEFMLPQGEPLVQTVSIAPHSRYTIHVNQVEGLSDTPVATMVESNNDVYVVAERASYFLYGEDIIGGHDSIGKSF